MLKSQNCCSTASVAQIRAAARRALGSVQLADAIRIFRTEMVDFALVQSSGSRRAAAKALGVTRPAVQHLLRHSKDVTLPEGVRASKHDHPREPLDP